MKHRTKKRYPSKKVVLTLVLIFAGVSIVVFTLLNWNLEQKAVVEKTINQDGVNYNAPTSQEIEAGKAIKNQTVAEDASGITKPKTTPVTITSVNQIDGGRTVAIRTLIDTISEGECRLSITTSSGPETYRDAVSTQTLANSTTCRGFDVPTSVLPRGTWNISIVFSGDGQVGNAKHDVEIH